MRRIGVTVAVTALTAGGGLAALGGPAQAAPAVPLAPLKAHPGAEIVADQYLVMYKPDATPEQMRKVEQDVTGNRGSFQFHYTIGVRGFAATLSAGALAVVRGDAGVSYVEPNAIVKAAQDNPPSWGLDRIDQHNLPLDNKFQTDSDGSGVNAYVIDSGLNASHTEFTGRVGNGVDEVDGGSPDDCNGHGTHVAGTIGGATFGVAKNVTIHAVRVLGCDNKGTAAAIVAGVNWVTQNHQSPAVANMSLGLTPPVQAIDDAVRASIASGVTYAVAAMNNSVDACTFSPADVSQAITVGASDINDTMAGFSDFGRCVDIFAPGVNITSAWIGSNTATNTISGTSMATPHVTGYAALFLQRHPFASEEQVRKNLIATSTGGVLSGVEANSPNLLLHTSRWTPWIEVPGQGFTPSKPAAVVFHSTQYVFARGENNHIFVNSRTGDTWSGWSEVPTAGVTFDAPTAALSNGRLFLFVRGTDNGLWQNVFDGSNWTGWSPVAPGIQIGAAPQALSLGLIQMDVIVTATNGHIYRNVFNGSAFTGWNELPGGGVTPSAPASTIDSQEQVYIRGMDNRIYGNRLIGGSAGSWTGWIEISGNGLTNNGPTAFQFNGDSWVFVQGTDNLNYLNQFINTNVEDTNGTGWGSVDTLTVADVPVPSSFNGTLDLFIRDPRSDRIFIKQFV